MADDNLDKGVGTEIKPGTISAAAAGITYIIAIGIDEYGFKGVNDFLNKNCEKDCTDFVNVLEQNYENFRAFHKDLEPAYLINENATKNKIITRIEDFTESTENNINNNLILYFSGHGDIIERTGTNREGCWVPHGIEDKRYKNLISNNELVDRFGALKVRHFLLISDSCKSGSIFKKNLVPAGVATADTENKDERSRWAIVSSRANELSKAGGLNENSKFTQKLLDILSKNKSPKIFISKLTSEIDDRFKDEGDQKPFWGRLNLDDTPNSGLFPFTLKEDEAKVRQRESLLKRKLKIFNYTDQRLLFLKIYNQKNSLTIFRGTVFCGLWLLSRIARETLFPSKQFIYRFVRPSDERNGEFFALDLLNKALKMDFKIKEALSDYILKLLVTNNLVLEVRYYADATNNIQLTPGIKRENLKLLAEFMRTIDVAYTGNKKLLLFIIDEEDYDYGAFYNFEKIANFETNYIPRTDPKELTEEKISLWYNLMQTEYLAEEGNTIENFNLLFDEVINEKIDIIYKNANGYPGSFIREICRSTKCINLESILNPDLT